MSEFRRRLMMAQGEEHYDYELDLGGVTWGMDTKESITFFGRGRIINSNRIYPAQLNGYQYIGEKNPTNLKDMQYSSGSYYFGPQALHFRNDSIKTAEEFKASMQGKILRYNI